MAINQPIPSGFEPLLEANGAESLNIIESDVDETCVICLDSLLGHGSLFKFPECGHEIHEACWYKWILHSQSDRLQCGRCTLPTNQYSVKSLMEMAVAAFQETTTDVCQEHLQQLQAIGDSPLLQNPEQASEDDLLGMEAARVVLLAHYMSRLMGSAKASLGWGPALLRIQWLQRQRSGGLRFLAALMWDMEPELIDALPVVARILQLQDGETEARRVLDDLQTDPTLPFWDIPTACEQLRQAFAEGSAGVSLEHNPYLLMWTSLEFIPHLKSWLYDVFQVKDWAQCQKCATQLAGISSFLRLNDPEHDQSEASMHSEAAELVLFAQYCLGLVHEVKEYPYTFSKNCEYLWRVKSLRSCDLASLVCAMMPDEAASMPIPMQLLQLDEGNKRVQHILDDICSRECDLWGFGTAMSVLRRALVQGDFDLFLKHFFPRLMYGMCEIFEANDLDLCRRRAEELRRSLRMSEHEPRPHHHEDVAEVVLFALYVSGLLKKVEASSQDLARALEQLQWLARRRFPDSLVRTTDHHHSSDSWWRPPEGPPQSKLLAALLWEMTAEQAAEEPSVVQVLTLQEGDTEGLQILQDLCSFESDMWDFKTAVAVVEQHLQRGDSGLCFRRLLPQLVRKIFQTFEGKDFESCRALLQQLLLLATPCVLFDVPVPYGPDALLQATATQAILCARFIEKLIQQAEASPPSIDWESAASCGTWLKGYTMKRNMRALAALVWEAWPMETALLPIAVRVLQLDEGEEVVQHLLEDLRADPWYPFWDCSQALAKIRKELAEGDAGACFHRLLPALMKKLREIFQAKNFERCSFLLLDLLSLGEPLLRDEAVPESWETLLGITATKAVLFAHYLSGVIQDLEASPDKDTTVAHRRLGWLLGHKKELVQMQFLAALVWERDPDQAAAVPVVAKLLKLHEGQGEVLQVLEGLYTKHGSPFFVFSQTVNKVRRALEQADEGACFAGELPLLLKETYWLFSFKKLEELRQALQELLALGEPHVLANEPEGPHSLLQLTATQAVLFVHYISYISRTLEAEEDVYDGRRGKAERRFEWLLDKCPDLERLQLVAALVWEVTPDQIPRLPVAAALLQLDQSDEEAHRILDDLYHRPGCPFQDWRRPRRRLQEPAAETRQQAAADPLPFMEERGPPEDLAGVEQLPEPRRDWLQYALEGEARDLQRALERSIEEVDPLQAVRNNPVLMQRQFAGVRDEEEEQEEEVFLLQFQRSSPESLERLHQGELLRQCREALEATGCSWLLDKWGVKVFVHPSQHHLVMELLRQHEPGALFPRHVVVTESFLPLVLDALQGCAKGAGKLKSQTSLGKVPLPAESEDPDTKTTLTSLGPDGQMFEPHIDVCSSIPPDGRQHLAFEDLFLLHFQRSPKEFQRRLHRDLRLQACRRALRSAGCRWLLEDEALDVGRFGLKVFVHPAQYHRSLQLLQQHRARGLHPRHVLVTATWLPVVLDTLKGCSGGGGALKPSNGQVKIGEVPACLHAQLEKAGMVARGSFLASVRHYHRHDVVQSTGTASNPRRRKPHFSAMSLSASSLEVGSTGGREDAMSSSRQAENGQNSHGEARVRRARNVGSAADEPQYPEASQGLDPIAEQQQLFRSHGFSAKNTFFDKIRRRRQRPVVVSTRTCKSNPRGSALGSEADEIDCGL